MKVLVTGGAGFIGSHTTDLLIEKGFDVRILDYIDPQVHGNKLPEYLNKQAEFMRGDVRKAEDWLKALDGCNAIIHLAGAVGVGQSMYQPVHYLDVNTLGTARMYQVLMEKNIKPEKIIVASSMSTYGEGMYECDDCGVVYPEPRPKEQLEKKDWEIHCPKCGRYVKSIATTEQKPQQNLSTYALSKYDQERLALNYGFALGIPTIAFRYFNVYGPRQSLSNPYTGVAAIFSSRIKNNNSPLIFEDGSQARDFIHIKDIARANLLALEKGEGIDVYNVGSGSPISILDVAKTLITLYKSNVRLEITNQFRKGDIRYCFADISKIKKDLGFKPKIDIKTGFKDLVEWGQTVEAKDKFEEAHNELKKYGLVD